MPVIVEAVTQPSAQDRVDLEKIYADAPAWLLAPHADAGALIDAGVAAAFRGPDSIRLGVAPLYTSYADIWDALDRLRAIAARTDLPDAPPARVT